jgi:hypothetical protein
VGWEQKLISQVYSILKLDSYSITNNKGEKITINENGISNQYERDYMFKRDEDYLKTQWIDVEDEHFIVWMQMESFSDFQKLYGKIETDLSPGTLTVSIKSSII